MSEARQRKLAHLRELRRLHPVLLSRGVPLRGTEQLAQGMALLFRDCLENRQNKRRVLNAAELAHRLYDEGEKNAPSSRPLHCKAGCDFCCHTFVSLLAPEALLLAERLKALRANDQASAVSTFKARAIALFGLDQKARLAGRRLSCPILENRFCSLHADRPLACRKHSSFAVEACASVFDGASLMIPAHTGYHTLGTTISVTFRGALKSLGYSTALYELSEAVSTILDTEDALKRWTAGDDILAGVQTDTSTSAQLTTVISSLAKAIS